MNNTSQPDLHTRIDHLVVVADSLAQGVEWCTDTLGVVPQAGGRHALMATHNRLLKIAAPAWPQAYLEIIAIDPSAESAPMDGRARWFGIDDARLRKQVAIEPRLVHFVAQTSNLLLAQAGLAAVGEDVGDTVAASRLTPEGELRWQITVRRDGRPQYGGALPALIEWDGHHPCDNLKDQGLRLLALKARTKRHQALRQAWSAIGLDSIELQTDAAEPALEAVLATPRGEVVLYGGFTAAD